MKFAIGGISMYCLILDFVRKRH